MKLPQIPETIRRRVREAARDRCGYCLSPQQPVMGALEIEHLVPRSKGGSDEEDNLWLSCSLRNRYKGAKTSAFDPPTGDVVQLFNPRCDNWQDHFRWSTDGVRIEGATSVGRATVQALRLNNELAVEVRRNWIRAGWHPPLAEKGESS